MAHEQFKTCIDACYECATECDRCAIACTGQADPRPLARCIALDVDCAEICRLAASCMGRGSEFAMAVCDVCAEVCEACAAECEKHDMDHCRRCAATCRRCAQECRRMAQAGQGRSGKPATGAHAH